MKLLTKELRRKIPRLHSQDEEPDPPLVCKFFVPDGGWTWYVIEGSTYAPDGCGAHDPLTAYDPEEDDILFFGYVVGDVPELGYFRLSELSDIRGALGLSVERDLHFTPCRLSELKERIKG